MIRNMVKYLILGTKEATDHFFALAQEQGFLEFITISQKKSAETPATIQNLLRAIKILKKQPLVEPYRAVGDLVLAIQLAERVVELKESLEKLQEEKRLLEAEKVRVAPFGYFSMDEIAEIEKRGKRKIQFFCRRASQEPVLEELIYIGTEYDLDYFISISKELIAPQEMIEMRIDAPFNEIQNRLDFVVDAIDRFEHDLKQQATYLRFFQDILIEELNDYHLQAAKKEVSYPLENSLFFIQVWLPENKVSNLYGLIDGMQIHAEPVALDPDDRIPTCLDNRGTDLIGEDLIKIYDIPATTDRDPSRWVLWFFALFFAVIVGDGGYGMLFLALAFYLKKKFPHLQGQYKRLLRLFAILSGVCVVWGVATSSYFGLKLSPGSPLAKISPLHALIVRKADYHRAAHDEVYQLWREKFPAIEKATSGEEMLQSAFVQKKKVISYPIVDEFTGNIILEFTLILGIIHISLSFLRYLPRHIAGLGWVVFMIGGYLFFPSMLNATTIPEFMGWISKSIASAFGLQCLFGGLGFALFAAVIQHRLKGLGEIANMVQVFSDVLSYLRLYALGLAGSIMASTFNQEGSALGLFVGFVVILAGHGINMLLSLMGGVIHGLRLNFLEWYHYSFTGGGKLFQPLHKLRARQ